LFRRPTKEEFEQCSHIELTSAQPKWKTGNGAYLRGESGMMGNDGNRLQQIVPHFQTRELMGMWTTKNMAKADNPFLEHIEKKIRVSSV
jgi:hypothetical protein